MGRVQILPWFSWWRSGRYKECDSIGNWEALMECFKGRLREKRGCSLTFITTWQRAWMTAWIKEVFQGCSGLYAPKTRWSVRCSFSAKTGGSAQSRRHSRLFFLDSTSCNLTVKRMEVLHANNSFHVRLHSGETKDLSCLPKGGLKWQWVWDATAVRIITVISVNMIIQQTFLFRNSWQSR